VQRLQPHLPSTREATGQRVLRGERLEGGVVLPGRDQGDPAGLGSGKKAAAQGSRSDGLGVAEARDVGGAGLVAEDLGCGARPNVGQLH
jgi:hypothetical protein